LFGEEIAVHRTGGLASGSRTELFLHVVRVHHAVVVLRKKIRLKDELFYIVFEAKKVVVFVAMIDDVAGNTF
jgi:hypothetical protein